MHGRLVIDKEVDDCLGQLFAPEWIPRRFSVPPLEAQASLYIFSAVQVLGIISAALARVSEGSRIQTLSHLLFFTFLGLVGAATVLAAAINSNYWTVCGATFSLMVVTVVWDLHGLARAEPA